MNPAEHKFLAYFDNTFELTIRLQDENGTAIPASTFDTIEHSIYTSANEISPIVSNDLTDGITVTEGNILSFSITAEENKTLFGDVLYHKLVLSSSGGRETYISGRYIVQNNSGSQNDGDYTLVVNQDNLDISLTLTEASVSTALALEAKNDAQAIKDSIEWKGVYDANETYTKDQRVSYEGSSYISLQDGNIGNTPVGNEADTWWDIIALGGDGKDGDTVIINSSGNWEISGTDTGVQAEGVDGVGIESIVLHATSGLDKTYRITFTDASTFDFVVSDGADGVDGDSAFVYIAYADDDTGTGFTTTFDASKDYIAVKSTTTEITPTASDFTGLWKNFKGDDGADGTFSDVENVNALGSVSGVVEVNLSLGTVITATLTAPIDLNITGLPSANQVYAFTLVFSGVFEITYPVGTLFAGGSAPDITGTDYEIPCSINSAGVLRVYGVIDEVA